MRSHSVPEVFRKLFERILKVAMSNNELSQLSTVNCQLLTQFHRMKNT